MQIRFSEIHFNRIGYLGSRESKSEGRGNSSIGIEHNNKTGSLFGHSVALSHDGGKVAVGEPWANTNGKAHSGRVEVFKRKIDSNEWELMGNGLDGLQINDWYGYAVAFDGSFLAVGAPKGSVVYVYKINEQYDTWDIIGREIRGKHPKDLFGYQVSLSEGGKRLGIGAPQDPEMGENSGAVSVYELQSGSYYTQLGESLHGNGKMCLFGSLMSISKNGVNVAIGGNLGFIYRYDNGE